MKITYHGHSCFSIESNNFTIVLDPFTGVEGYKEINLKANMVICSHEHFDHNYVKGVEVTPKENPFEISYLDSFHDDCQGAKRGTNKIAILKSEGKRIVHMGDLGHMLSADAINTLKGCDVLLIPVGGCFTIGPEDALKLIDLINPNMVIPMHYRFQNLGIDKLADIDTFLSMAGSIKEKLALVNGFDQSIEI